MSAQPTLPEALDDVEARFLYNLPESELAQVDRLFFQIEQAYWYYEDFKADKHPHLPHYPTLKSFAVKIFSHSSLLSSMGEKFQELFADFRNYKSKIPVYGCILLNKTMNNAVMVSDFKSKTWTFPRGKINENETEFACAIREVFEETGFDASAYCVEANQLVAFQDGKQVKLFIGTNIPDSAQFTITSRKEIADVAFHPLDNLPKTYGVQPFIPKLKRWISKNPKGNNSNSSANNSGSSKSQLLQPQQILIRSPAARKGNSKNTTLPVAPVVTAGSPARNASTSSKKNIQKQNQRSPATKGLPAPSSNAFDKRNMDTFADEMNTQASASGKKGWGVAEMFEANAKITGRDYKDYDGNPHNFGSQHPRYVDYNDAATTNTATTGTTVAGTNAVDTNAATGIAAATRSYPSVVSTSSTATLRELQQRFYPQGESLLQQKTQQLSQQQLSQQQQQPNYSDIFDLPFAMDTKRVMKALDDALAVAAVI